MNLTPTQKADELIESLLKTEIDFPYIDTEDGQCIGSGYMTYKSAVKIAIKSVDEIIEFSRKQGDKLYLDLGTASYEARCINYDMGNYFKEVKQILTDRL